MLDRDVTIASMFVFFYFSILNYKKFFILLFRYEKVSILVLKSGKKETFMERLNIYEFSTNDPFAIPQLTKTLLLNLDGFVGVHVIDNAIFVHHKVFLFRI